MSPLLCWVALPYHAEVPHPNNQPDSDCLPPCGGWLYWLSLIGAAVGLGLTAWALAKMDMTDGHGGSAGLWRWWLALGVGWLSLTGLARWLWRRDGPVLFRWRDVLLLVFVAIAVRVVVVATSQPQLSDDVYRYVVDGQAVAHGDSPYVATPLQRAQQLINDGAPMWPGEDEVLAHVNNPELHTIYLPTSQWVFGFSATVANNTGAVSASEQVEIQRYVLSLIDVLVICLLLVIAWRHKRSIWWVALYAWHPLVVTEVAGSGHQEPIGLFFLVLALFLVEMTPRAWWIWIVPLALSVFVKPITVFIAPVLLRRSPPLHWLGALVLGIIVCFLVASPFVFAGSEFFTNLWATTSRFTLKWAHFGSVYEPLLWLIERVGSVGNGWTNDSQEQLARGCCIFLLLAIICWVVFKGLPKWSAARIILFAMVLLSPAAHPWYLLWPLVMMPIVPSAALWIASLTISFGYAAWLRPNDWEVSWWVFLIAYVPVYVALAWSLIRRVGPDRSEGRHGNV